MQKYLFTIFILIFISCGLKQPVNTESNLDTGSIYVTSNFNGAEIFLNYNSTSKFTPDTLKNLPENEYIIQAVLPGYYANPDSYLVYVLRDTTITRNFIFTEIINSATIYVESSPEGAQIWIDNSYSGYDTPSSVTVESGQKLLSLKKQGFKTFHHEFIINPNDSLEFNFKLIPQPQVLIESFANSSCLPCTTTCMLLEDFEQEFESEQYAIIEYFTNFPNFNDPLYQHNPDDNFSRISFYQIFAAPSLFINGVAVDAVDYQAISGAFESKFALLPEDLSLSLNKQIADSIKVRVEIESVAALPPGDWRLFVAVTEELVEFDQPPGSNGLKIFRHVFRAFLSSNQGYPFILENGLHAVRFAKKTSSVWDITRIRIVAFIQDINTKDILIAAEI